jgi:hypothetical protein
MSSETSRFLPDWASSTSKPLCGPAVASCFGANRSRCRDPLGHFSQPASTAASSGSGPQL